MSKNKSKKPVPRNSSVMSARSRVAGMAPMKSKNTPRGGQKNEQRELLEGVEEERNPRHCAKSNDGCGLGKFSQGPSGYCDCYCEVCTGVPGGMEIHDDDEF